MSQNAPSRPRVFVLSDIRLLREGLVSALSLQPSVLVVGSSGLSEPPRQIADLLPDALLIDITVPGGLDAWQLIRGSMSEVKVVALGVAEIEQAVMACARAGVSGFVAPNGSINDVVAAVHSAVRGELVCSPRTAAMLLNLVSALNGRPSADPDKSMLTQREQEIVLLLNEGLSNKQIARSLNIQSATVKNHVHSILSKLRVSRRGEVAAQLRRGRVGGLENFALSELLAVPAAAAASA
ncbi:response regulator protein VraR [mine drainage metagenome]|uniref:Response regulator protein VraR n=1 Tax=mine drainage metagenome TaxID=410659 RepID=A0A1J5P607_9ZZZZ